MDTQAELKQRTKQNSSRGPSRTQAAFQQCLTSEEEKGRRPAFLFFYKDWLSDSGVGKLSRSEKGFYIDLLCYLFQEEGYLYAPEKLEDGDILEMLNVEKSEGEKVINKLLRVKCLYRDENGYVFNKRMVKDIENYKAKQRAGKAGGKKARANEKLKQNSSRTQAEDQAKLKQNSSRGPSKTQAEGQAEPNIAIAVAIADINNSLSIAPAHARASQKNETDTHTIEPPPGMPRTEEEAVSMAELAGVPAEFVREKAYPKILSVGFRDGNTVIRNFGAWAKLYYGNAKNAQKRKEAATSPVCNGKAQKRSSSFYDSTSIPEL